jgi:hypothetical protein
MGIPVWESGVRINVPRKIVGGPRGPDDRGFRRMLTECRRRQHDRYRKAVYRFL